MAPTSTIERARLTRKMYSKLKVHITNVRSNQEKGFYANRSVLHYKPGFGFVGCI